MSEAVFYGAIRLANVNASNYEVDNWYNLTHTTIRFEYDVRAMSLEGFSNNVVGGTQNNNGTIYSNNNLTLAGGAYNTVSQAASTYSVPSGAIQMTYNPPGTWPPPTKLVATWGK